MTGERRICRSLPYDFSVGSQQRGAKSFGQVFFPGYKDQSVHVDVSSDKRYQTPECRRIFWSGNVIRRSGLNNDISTVISRDVQTGHARIGLVTFPRDSARARSQARVADQSPCCTETRCTAMAIARSAPWYLRANHAGNSACSKIPATPAIHTAI